MFTQLLAKSLSRQWKVVNLGLDRCRISAGKFRDLLKTPSAFEFLLWPDLSGRIPTPREAWFEKYLHEKKLV